MTYLKTIVIFGAGKSATALIDYLLEKSVPEGWKIVIVDADLKLALDKAANHPNAAALSLDIRNDEERVKLINHSDLIISMLPPTFHYMVAKDCVQCKKNLLTASYIDEQLKQLAPDIKNSGLLFICELGLDPGIDHMSAMRLIEEIKNEKGTIISFKSHCGGLIAPESDDNPWHYKITWNPANIVNAGKPGARYKENGKIARMDYADIFKNPGTVDFPKMGIYSFYPNRDSVSYMELYGLQNAQTFIRTTLRHPGFCKGWYAIILAGLTDSENDYLIKKMRKDGVNNYFSINIDSLKNYIAPTDHNLITRQFEYLGLFDDIVVPDQVHSPATFLQYLLESRLALKPGDKDMVLMLHEVDFIKNNMLFTAKSRLVVMGDGYKHTAMAKTVGLPLAIASELVLKNKITLTGLHIPVIKEIYEPVLKKLAEHDIVFKETRSRER